MQKNSNVRGWWTAGASFLLFATIAFGSPQEATPPTEAPPDSTAAAPATASAQASVPAPSKDTKAENTSKDESKAPYTFSLHNGITIELSGDWQKIAPVQAAPPGPLGPYAPPVHFSDELVLENDRQDTILKIATSDNPLLGHDSYWLDSQLHSAPGSGMSMTDLLFYLFLPPSRSCLDHTLEAYTAASRSAQTGDPSTQSDLQVSYSCSFSKTISDFYASQLSSAVTYEQTNDGPRAHPVVKDFQLAPMEQLDVAGMTFFIFEAQGMQEISADDAARFNLPAEMQGGHADFFWAIGSESPFPFVRDATRKDGPIIQVVYAGVAPGPNPNKRPDFLELLHHIQLQKAPE